MTQEQRDNLLARAIALRGDIESLIERIDIEADKRNVNPFWARWLARTLMHDRNALNIALDRVLHYGSVRNAATGDMGRVWSRLETAFDSGSFAMTYGHQLLMEELA